MPKPPLATSTDATSAADTDDGADKTTVKQTTVSRGLECATANDDGNGAGFASSSAATGTARRELLTKKNAKVGARVDGPDGPGRLVGWKCDGVRVGDTGGGLTSDDFCRIHYDVGSHQGGWNLPMKNATIVLTSVCALATQPRRYPCRRFLLLPSGV